VVYDRTHANTLLCSEQTLPVLPLEPVMALESISIEPQGGRGVSQASRIHQSTSHISNESSSGTSGVPDTLSALNPGQGSSVHNLLMPLTTPQLQVEEPEGIHSGDASQVPNEIFLEEVVPEKGPITGGIHIIILGENFPSTPLHVAFGDNWVRAVSQT